MDLDPEMIEKCKSSNLLLVYHVGDDKATTSSFGCCVRILSTILEKQYGLVRKARLKYLSRILKYVLPKTFDLCKFVCADEAPAKLRGLMDLSQSKSH